MEMASSPKRFRLRASVTRMRQFTRSSSASEYQTLVQGISASSPSAMRHFAPFRFGRMARSGEDAARPAG